LEDLRAVRRRRGVGGAAVLAALAVHPAQLAARGAGNTRGPVLKHEHERQPSPAEQEAAQRPGHAPGAGKGLPEGQPEAEERTGYRGHENPSLEGEKPPALRGPVQTHPGDEILGHLEEKKGKRPDLSGSVRSVPGEEMLGRSQKHGGFGHWRDQAEQRLRRRRLDEGPVRQRPACDLTAGAIIFHQVAGHELAGVGQQVPRRFVPDDKPLWVIQPAKSQGPVVLPVESQRSGEDLRTRLIYHVDRLVGADEHPGQLLFLILPPDGPQNGLPVGGSEEGSDGAVLEIQRVPAAGKRKIGDGAYFVWEGKVIQLAREPLPRLLAGRDETIRAEAADPPLGLPVVALQAALVGGVEPALAGGAGIVL